jgi:hypothetical protein
MRHVDFIIFQMYGQELNNFVYYNQLNNFSCFELIFLYCKSKMKKKICCLFSCLRLGHILIIFKLILSVLLYVYPNYPYINFLYPLNSP